MASDLHSERGQGGSVMGSLYRRGTIYGLKHHTTSRETARARAIRASTGTERETWPKRA